MGVQGVPNQRYGLGLLALVLIWLVSLAHDDESSSSISWSMANTITSSELSQKHREVQNPLETVEAPTQAHHPEPPPTPYDRNEPLIPRKIWHILFPIGDAVTDRQVAFVGDWIRNAPGHTYTFLSTTGGSALVAAHYGHNSEELDVFKQLTNPTLKSDFLRYLVLAAQGGYYGDVDTRPLIPLNLWVPPELRPQVRLLCAPEHDDAITPDPSAAYKVRFGQWAIAAAPGHPVLRRMVRRAMEGLRYLSQSQNTTLDMVRPDNIQVLNATGPLAWTEILWEYLFETDPNITSQDDLSGLATPKLVGDVLVLPITAFRAPTAGEAPWFEEHGDHRLLEHHMLGTWRQWQPPS
ncbi:hypothetical protein JX266_003883 [Neoarthrinium moseri]|nr:hypothetical protein JX266_003883 [Neoarthrinium moseri]